MMACGPYVLHSAYSIRSISSGRTGIEVMPVTVTTTVTVVKLRNGRGIMIERYSGVPAS